MSEELTQEERLKRIKANAIGISALLAPKYADQIGKSNPECIIATMEMVHSCIQSCRALMGACIGLVEMTETKERAADTEAMMIDMAAKLFEIEVMGVIDEESGEDPFSEHGPAFDC